MRLLSVTAVVDDGDNDDDDDDDDDGDVEDDDRLGGKVYTVEYGSDKPETSGMLQTSVRHATDLSQACYRPQSGMLQTSGML